MSRIKQEESSKNYSSLFSTIGDPRAKLISSNTLKDLKARTTRQSISNLQLPLRKSRMSSSKMLDSVQSEDLHLPAILRTNRVPLLLDNDSSQGFLSNLPWAARTRKTSKCTRDHSQPACGLDARAAQTIDPRDEHAQSSGDIQIVEHSPELPFTDRHYSSLAGTGGKNLCLGRSASHTFIDTNLSLQFPNIQTEEMRASWLSLYDENLLSSQIPLTTKGIQKTSLKDLLIVKAKII